MRSFVQTTGIGDSAGKFPVFDVLTTGFVYLRLHGAEELYVSGYSKQALSKWAARIKAWKKRCDVYVYFDNDAKVHAPFDALQLKSLLGEVATLQTG